jgi:hypothetical protein
MSRARGPVETLDYGKMVARMMRSWAKRVTHADEPELAQMIAAADALELAIARAIHGQRTIYGRSWAEIARGTGTTRQEAQRRWGALVSALDAASLDRGQVSDHRVLIDHSAALAEPSGDFDCCLEEA